MTTVDAATALLGHTVSVTLKVEPAEANKFTSVLFAVDKARGLVVFRSSPAHTFAKGEYRLVPLSAIAAIEDSGASTEPLPSFRAVTSAESGAKLSQALEAIEKKRLTRGVGVSAFAQGLFDGINKTMECVWDKDQIRVVKFDVLIRPPYGDGDVGVVEGVDPSAPATKSAYERVKLVAEKVRAQLATAAAAGGAGASAEAVP